ncbi:MAG: hypothetical protein ACREBG_21890 [Pyrinomonadaceae bacterium]
MNQQTAFNLYWIAIVGILAQSILAWEWGFKGMDYLRRHGLGPKIWFAFGLFAVGGIWTRASALDFPYKTLKDCWPVLISIVCFLIARARRPKRLNSFLKAKQLYEDYMRNNIRTEPTDQGRRKARNDPSLVRAESLYRNAIESSRQQGEIYDVAVASFQLGMLLDLQGRNEEATEAFQTPLNLAPRLRRDNNMIGTISGCYYRLGLISKRKGDSSAARSLIEKSLELDEEINDIHGQRLCRETLDALERS